MKNLSKRLLDLDSTLTLRVFQAIKKTSQPPRVRSERERPPPRILILPPTALDCLHRTSRPQIRSCSAQQEGYAKLSTFLVGVVVVASHRRARRSETKKKRPKGQKSNYSHF